MASCMRACFTCQNAKEELKDEEVPHNIEVLQQKSIRFKPESQVREPLAPVDLLPFCFRHYMPWAFFFNYDIKFQRLVKALNVVSQKYLMLCSRLCTDDTGKYYVEVRHLYFKYLFSLYIKVGSNVKRIYDFPVVEVCARMPMAEAVLQHGRITTKSAEYPVHPDNLPFYLDSLDVDAIHKGQDPFLKVKLTHFSDGSCLAISMSHILVDGMRFSELFRDISRAYRGKEVTMRDIKREYMMVESFSKHFNEKDKEGCVVPKTMPTGREPMTYKKYPNESSSLEVLYFSKKLIDDMKLRVASFIPKGSFVSTANIMHALLWMLDCEMNSTSNKITTSEDLSIVGTMSAYSAELLVNGFQIVPSNYLGNALYDPVLIAGEDMKYKKSLLELLAALALLIRQKQIEIQDDPKELLRLLIARYFPLESIPEQCRAAVSNICKLPISEVDFGQGVTGLFLCNANLPFVGTGWFVTPLVRTGGVLVHLTVTKKQKTKMKASCVLRNCAPGVKNLFEDFDAETLNKLMKKN